jgi:thermitase
MSSVLMGMRAFGIVLAYIDIHKLEVEMGKYDGLVSLALLVIIFVMVAGCSGPGKINPNPVAESDDLWIIDGSQDDSDGSGIIETGDLIFDLISTHSWIDPGVQPGTTHYLEYNPGDLGDGTLVTWETSDGHFIDVNGEETETIVNQPGEAVTWVAPKISGPTDISVRASGPEGSVEDGFDIEVDPGSLPMTEQPYHTTIFIDDSFGGEIEIAAGELLVGFSNDGNIRACSSVIDAADVRPMALVDSKEDIYRVRISHDVDIKDARDALNGQPGVAFAEYNYIYHLSRVVPDDSYWNNKWDLERMNALDAWEIEEGSSEVIVAVIDTGVDRDHPDLVNRIVAGADFVTGGDGSGGEIMGDSIDNNLNGWTDENVGHGTHCAGIIGAEGYNGIGTIGVNLSVKIMPLRVFPVDGDGGASTSSISSAMNYAVSNGAKVLNLSLSSAYYSTTLDIATTNAVNNGVSVVCAAGNYSTDSMHYPAAYPEAIAVASIAEGDTKSYFSNYGTWVDICAPGSSIQSTYFNNIYAIMSGTSMAAPEVAGVAALIRAYKPDLTEAEVREALEDGADAGVYDVNPSYTGKLGSGCVDMLGSLEFLTPVDNLGPYAEDAPIEEATPYSGGGRLSRG